jgi:hypothetical protein
MSNNFGRTLLRTVTGKLDSYITHNYDLKFRLPKRGRGIHLPDDHSPGCQRVSRTVYSPASGLITSELG